MLIFFYFYIEEHFTFLAGQTDLGVAVALQFVQLHLQPVGDTLLIVVDQSLRIFYRSRHLVFLLQNFV